MPITSQQYMDALKHSSALRETYLSVEHIHYCTLKHLRDCLKTGDGVEAATAQADRLEKKVGAAYAEYRKAADAANQIHLQFQLEAA